MVLRLEIKYFKGISPDLGIEINNCIFNGSFNRVRDLNSIDDSINNFTFSWDDFNNWKILRKIGSSVKVNLFKNGFFSGSFFVPFIFIKSSNDSLLAFSKDLEIFYFRLVNSGVVGDKYASELVDSFILERNSKSKMNYSHRFWQDFNHLQIFVVSVPLDLLQQYLFNFPILIPFNFCKSTFRLFRPKSFRQILCTIFIVFNGNNFKSGSEPGSGPDFYNKRFYLLLFFEIYHNLVDVTLNHSLFQDLKTFYYKIFQVSVNP